MAVLITKPLLQKCLSNSSGVLCGLEHGNNFLLTGYLSSLNNAVEVKKLEAFLPTGVNVIFSLNTKTSFSKFHIVVELVDENIKATGFKYVNGNVQELPVSTLKEEEAKQILIKSFISFKITSRISLNLHDSSGEQLLEANSLTKPTKSIYYVPEYKTILSRGSVETKYSKKNVGEIFKTDLDKPIAVEVFEYCSCDNDVVVPIMKLSENKTSFQSTVETTSKLYVDKNFSLKKLYEQLLESYSRQKTMLEQTSQLITSVNGGKAQLVGKPDYFEYLLPSWLHPITVCYPKNKNEDDLLEYRKDTLHKLFMQEEVPTFRRNLAYTNNSQLVEAGNKIVTPHLGLKDFEGYQQAFVDGKYLYYHYKQDGMDDTGWGCAYRSLQTIVSWACYHGYCNKKVPNHTEIQQTLVSIGDKPRRFIQSSSWIGSIEVQRVLDEWAGMQSRIITLNSGSQISEKAREILMHFRTEGTPIMIGGGVLAHTIVGIAFNELTGDSRFVVLDPHYPGKEDLTTIHKKGWCGWKQDKFWGSNSFYNLCLPLRNKEV